MSPSYQSPLVSQAFKPAAWLKCIEQVKRWVLSEHALMTFHSDTEVEKQAFIDLMCAKLEASIRTIWIKIDPENLSDDWRRTLGTMLGVVLPEEDPIPETIFTQIFSHVKPQQPPVLVMIEGLSALSADQLQHCIEAYQHMSASSFVSLCFVTTGDSPVLKAALIGQADPQIKVITPGPLTETEARTYLSKAIQGASRLSWLVENRHFSQVYQMTQGHMANLQQLVTLLQQQPIAPGRMGVMSWGYVLLALVTLLLGGIFYGIQMGSYVIPPEARPITMSALSSRIPPWFQASTRSVVSPPPLQRFADALLASDEETALKSDLVVLDKVVIIPEIKSLHSQLVPLGGG